MSNATAQRRRVITLHCRRAVVNRQHPLRRAGPAHRDGGNRLPRSVPGDASTGIRGKVSREETPSLRPTHPNPLGCQAPKLKPAYWPRLRPAPIATNKHSTCQRARMGGTLSTRGGVRGRGWRRRRRGCGRDGRPWCAAGRRRRAPLPPGTPGPWRGASS